MADESRRIGRIGGLRAGHDCGTCADMLEDIKRTPRGNDIRLPIGPNTTSGVRPRQGVSPGRQADTALVGGPAGGGHAGLSQEIVDLPPVDNPYEYEPIDPYDDRYDFRLGKKVNDIGINGTNPVGPQSFPSPEGQFDNPGVQLNPAADPAADAEADDRARQTPVSDPAADAEADDRARSRPTAGPDDGLRGGSNSGSQSGSRPLPRPGR